MICRIDHKQMGTGEKKWLKSLYHFSFAGYENPDNIRFGALRVLNDDLISPGRGFDPHPHSNMEIVTYVVEGQLTHGDSMGNKRTLSRGDMQYMSAGTGLLHSEFNLGEETLRLLQIWILPDRKGNPPEYGDHEFHLEDRKNTWLHMVSPESGKAPIRLHQDVNLYALELEEDLETEFPVGPGRQAYLVQIEGSARINGTVLEPKDALETVEEDLKIRAIRNCHFLVIEMSKDPVVAR